MISRGISGSQEAALSCILRLQSMRLIFAGVRA